MSISALYYNNLQAWLFFLHLTFDTPYIILHPQLTDTITN